MVPGRDMTMVEDANTTRLVDGRGQARPGRIVLVHTMFRGDLKGRWYKPLPPLEAPPVPGVKTWDEAVQRAMAAKTAWALPKPEAPVADVKHPEGCLCERHKLKVKQRNRFVHPLSKASR